MFAALAASCSVMEDRTQCPCYVSVRTQTDKECLVSFFSAEGELLAARNMTSEELCTGENVTKIRKGDFYVSVLKNKGDMSLVGSRAVHCARGQQSEAIFADSKKEYVMEDQVMVDCLLKKQHTVVTVHFNSTTETGFPFRIMVSGSGSGLDLVSLESSKGEFTAEPQVDDTRTTSFRLPRQTGSEPIFIIFLDNESGEEKARFDLNDYVRKTGYDWNADSLSDIDITVDYNRMVIIINVEPWGEVVIKILD